MLLRSFLAALTFLTLLPAGGSRMFTQREISVSRGFYPLVGLLIGLLLVALERGAGQLFPLPLTAAILLLALLVITRGLHFDGFMDVCDGLFGGYTGSGVWKLCAIPTLGPSRWLVAQRC